MTPSREHDDAVGEAPSATRRLADLRTELADVVTKLRAANAAYDADAAVALEARQRTLEKFIRDLAPLAQDETEADARREAVAVRDALTAEYRKAISTHDDQLLAAHKAIEAACDRLAVAAKGRARLGLIKWELGVLHDRFEVGVPTLDTVPPWPNLLGSIQDLTEEAVRRPPLPCPAPITAAMGPAERRRVTLWALRPYLASFREVFSPSVRQLFDSAPLPDPTVAAQSDADSPATVGLTESLRQAAELAEFARQIDRGLGAVRNQPESPRTKAANAEKRARILHDRAEEGKRLKEEADRLRNAPPPAQGPLGGMRGDA